MKYFIILLSIFIPILIFGQHTFDYQYRNDLTFHQRVSMAEAHFDKHGRGKGKGYKQFLRWKYWAQKSLDHRGYVISNGEATRSLERFNREYPVASSRSLSANPMTEMGPRASTVTTSHSSALGRLLSIAIANDNTFDHIIVASDGGGVWKSRNGGSTWQPIFEIQPNMDVQAVAISHADSAHYFAGMFETGLAYSTDGGISWTAATGIGSHTSINQINMHPTDPSIVFALSQEEGFLYKSIDGGISFTLILSFGAPLYDVEFKPAEPDTMYVAGEGGLTRSIDGGTTWTAATGAFISEGGIMMAVSPIDPTVVYALQASDAGGFHALFKSTDSGINFNVISDNSSGFINILGYDLAVPGGQAPRDMDVVVSPVNIDLVHVGGIDNHKSIDGGVTWTQTSGWTYGGIYPFVHADQDALYYITRNDEHRIYFANDGGIYYSRDSASTFTDITIGMGIRDFYRMDVSKTVVDWVQGGSQDNGTSVLRTDGIWYDWAGADGGSVLIDHADHLNMWCTQNGGTLEFTDDGGNTVLDDYHPGGETSFTFPLFQHPTQASTIFMGASDSLFKSIDGGMSWTALTEIAPLFSLSYAEIAPSDGDVIYTGSSEGQVFKTQDGGLTWTDVSPAAVGNFAIINWITIHPNDANRLTIALSAAANTAKLMESLDGGMSWTDITFNLPNIGAQCVEYEGDSANGIYIGMDPGLFFKDDNLPGQWVNAGASRGLPNTSIVDLEVAHNNLYICTFGRGIWKAALTSSPPSCQLSNISSTPIFDCVAGMKTATITWVGNDTSVTFIGGNGSSPASISAATGNSATFTYAPTQSFFGMSLSDSEGHCSWSYSGVNGTNCTSNACTTTGGMTCGSAGHPSIAGLYNSGNSSNTFSYGGNAMVGRTVFLCGGQSFCATGATGGFAIEADTSGNLFVAMGIDGIKKLSFTTSGNCSDVWINNTETPTGVAFKNGRLFISGGAEIIELDPSTGGFIQFWDLSNVISAAGEVVRIEEGPGNIIYFSDNDSTAGGFGTFDIVTEIAVMLPGAMGSMIKRAEGMEYANGWLLAVERGQPGMGEGKIWAIEPNNPTAFTEIASGFDDIFDVDYTTASGGNVLVADGGAGQIKSFGCALVDTPPSTCPLEYTLANGNRITGLSTQSFDYETDGVIESNQQIISPHAIYYDSGNEIILLPNFEIQLGATLDIIIDGCGGNN